MNQSRLTPLAKILVHAYLETAVYSHQFSEGYGQPPTLFAKVHNLLAIAQSLVNKSDHYQLCPEYIEFGKLQVIDRDTGRQYLVRSSRAYEIEDARQQPLFPSEVAPLETPVVMVIRRFHKDGLDLSIAGTRQQPGRLRLTASGPATFVGTWPYGVMGGDQPFNQGVREPFEEVGPADDVDESGEAG